MTDFAKAGATIGKASDAGKADVVLKVRRPTDAELKGYKSGAAVIAIMDPYGNDAAVAAHGEGRRDGLCHGVHAAHHARPVDGRAVQPGQPRRLSGGDRRRRPNMTARCR